MTDTAFLGIDGETPGVLPVPGTKPRPWKEAWTLDACGKRSVVEMRFIPDTTGTAIKASLPAS